MTPGHRGLSDAQRAELWQRWKAGNTLTEIGRALGKLPASIFGVVVGNGGYAPSSRARSERSLSLSEREEISRGLTKGLSLRRIAAAIGRAASTVSREVAANGGKAAYRAADADSKACSRALRPKTPKLREHVKLQRAVASKLSLDSSPEQIAGWLRRAFPNRGDMNVSHETIYKSLFIQARGVLKKELIDHLRSRRIARRSIKSTTKGQARGQIVGVGRDSAARLAHVVEVQTRIT